VGEEATTSFVGPVMNNNLGQGVVTLERNGKDKGVGNGEGSLDEKQNSGIAPSKPSGSAELLGSKDEDDGERDATTYRGIYLPTLTNRFKEKKLETAYQRYACRQVRSTLLINFFPFSKLIPTNFHLGIIRSSFGYFYSEISIKITFKSRYFYLKSNKSV